MEQTNIILENGLQSLVYGIFYVFNSKYYFMYTLKELESDDYVQLYIVQVSKEIQTTPTGPIDTGYMVGNQISNHDEWVTVQQSITKIVEDKKSKTQSEGIHYLPITMLTNLKIIGKNKFKLMKHIIEENFKVSLGTDPVDKPVEEKPKEQLSSDVIIDYRAKFFEEQDKNEQLQEQLTVLQNKLDSITQILQGNPQDNNNH